MQCIPTELIPQKLCVFCPSFLLCQQVSSSGHVHPLLLLVQAGAEAG